MTARLEDLFAESSPAMPAPRRRWLGRAAFQLVAISAVVYTAARAIGIAPSLPLLLTVIGGAVLVRAAAGAAGEPPWRRVRDVMRRPPDPPDVGRRDDGMLAAVRIWDRRLAVERTVAGALNQAIAELADERLRQHHGVTRAGDPERARRLLGEPLWSLPGRGSLTPAELEAAVRRLEQL
jgi:hypothetical protein